MKAMKRPMRKKQQKKGWKNYVAGLKLTQIVCKLFKKARGRWKG